MEEIVASGLKGLGLAGTVIGALLWYAKTTNARMMQMLEDERKSREGAEKEFKEYLKETSREHMAIVEKNNSVFERIIDSINNQSKAYSDTTALMSTIYKKLEEEYDDE